VFIIIIIIIPVYRLLAAGCSMQDIFEGTRLSREARRLREETNRQMKWDGIHYFGERTRRTVRKLLFWKTNQKTNNKNNNKSDSSFFNKKQESSFPIQEKNTQWYHRRISSSSSSSNNATDTDTTNNNNRNCPAAQCA
jgi:hypothetical protein